MEKNDLGPPQPNWFCLKPGCNFDQAVTKSRSEKPMEKCPQCGNDDKDLILDMRMFVEDGPAKEAEIDNIMFGHSNIVCSNCGNGQFIFNDEPAPEKCEFCGSTLIIDLRQERIDESPSPKEFKDFIEKIIRRSKKEQ